jgi:DNA-binding winged helix-turn-helix (wHTH) protein
VDRAPGVAVIAFPPFRLDPDEDRLWRGETPVTVRRKPLAILRHLVTHAHRLVTHDELILHVWRGAMVSESAMRSHVHELRQALGDGVIETVIGRGYRFIAKLADEDPVAPPEPAPTPAVEIVLAADHHIVGRDAELDALRAAFARADAGHRQLCFVTGEPGIGKTTLIDRFLAELAARPDVVAVRGQCIEQHGTPEAYLAVIDMFTRLRRSAAGDRVVATLIRHAPTFVAQTPHLVPDDQLGEVLRRARGGSDARLVRELSEALEALAADHTLVVVVEDLQWSDVATIDLLAQLGQRRDRARLLVVGTSRHAEAHTVTHPLNRVMLGLVTRAGAHEVPLARIAPDAIRRFVELRFPDHAFPAALIDVIDRITAGTPLFVVHILDDLVARKLIEQRDGRWELAARLDDVAAHRPDTVKQMIDIQLDRLAPEEQRVLEAAATVGLELSTALVAAALELPIERVDEVCADLARRGLFLRRDGLDEWPDGAVSSRYRVTHGLVQEVCHARSAPARRQRWHRIVAERLEAAYGDRAGEIASVLASHYHQGQVPARAVHHYMAAGAQAVQRFAMRDAMTLYARALDLLFRTPDGGARDALEVQIHAAMAPGLLRVPGLAIADCIAALERMAVLAAALDDAPRRAEALLNLSALHTLAGHYARGGEVCDELERLVPRAELAPGLAALHAAVRGTNDFWRGRVAGARLHWGRLTTGELGVEGVTVGLLGPTDRNAISFAYVAMVDWLEGDPERAVDTSDRGIAIATAAGDPYQLGAALCYAGRLRFLRGDPPAQIQALAERVLADAGAVAWHAQAAVLADWARGTQAPLDAAELAGLERAFRERLAHYPMGATIIGLPVVDALRRSGRAAAALVEELIGFAGERGEHAFLAELYRVRGALVEAGDPAAAAAAYRGAVDHARSLGLVGLERRAAADLARLDADSTVVER